MWVTCVHDSLRSPQGGSLAHGYHAPMPSHVSDSAVGARRTRLDVALVERGLVETRARAQAAIIAGRVRVGGHRVDKPGTSVLLDGEITVEQTSEYVSRGGNKLAAALDATQLDVTGARAIDVGASTGGFTDCLLRRGAAEVIAVDVGYGQLDWRLRTDPRVHVMERTNARHLKPEMLTYAPDLVAVDASFISVTTIWPAVAACLAPGWRALIMVKPQFEVGRAHIGSKGVVRDPAQRLRAVVEVAEGITASGGVVLDAADSGVPGPQGNREVFLLAVDGASGAIASPVDLDGRIRRAVEVGDHA
jgi:23S rRNA (cytidine1920-2'-O)/16S rRNA (cytidine1409-2'-O)-methyltransferase